MSTAIAIESKTEPQMIEVEIVCPECKGAKTVERMATVRPWSDDPYEYVMVTCPTCKGNDVLIVERCEYCGKSEYECKCLG